MSSRIESLTSAQIEAMPRYVDEWTRIGLCTDPADRPAAEEGVRLAYAAAGRSAPARIIWTGSPLGNARAAHGMRSHGEASVGDKVWGSVRASVGDKVWGSVRASVVDSVVDSVRASVVDSVWASVGDSVRDSVVDSVRDPVRDPVGNSVYGQHEAAWLSFYDFFGRECGLRADTEPLRGLMQMARSAGWFLPYEDVCIISERHNVLCRDARGRLHADGGPAVAYPDGWSIYAWHGVRVPEAVIMRPETITADAIKAETNAEIRRCMVERVGSERAIELLGAREVHRDDCGRLLKADGHAWVEVENGTQEPDGSRKTYLLKVPTTVRTARGAVAWTYGVETKDYRVAVRT